MVKKSYKMLRIEYLVLCISLVLICKQVAARSPPKVQKRHDEVLQTYIYEPNDDYQADATTAFPPLVEYDSNNPVSFFFFLNLILFKFKRISI